MKAHYRKINDRSRNSSTYHKKDGTNVRAKLKAELNKETTMEVLLRCPKCGCEEDLMDNCDGTMWCPDCDYESREENFEVINETD